MRHVHFLTSLLAVGMLAAIPSARADEGEAGHDHEAAAAAPAAAAATGDQPDGVIEQTSYEAGDVPKGTVIEHDFVVKNNGKADLMITSVAPACGCTVPDWTKLLPPGGTGKITLKVDTARFKGPIQKTATVTSNDPEMTNLRLTVAANVTTYIDVTPSETVTFRQYRGEEKREEVTLHSNESGAFEIKDVQVTGQSAASVKHELKKVEGSEDYKLAVWLDPASPIGTISADVKLVTNSAKEPEVKVGVRGTVLGQITVSPSSLFFRIDSGSTPSGYTANTDNLNLRERGELGAPVVTKLAKGAKLTSLGEAGEWLRVRTEDGKEGWVSKKLVATIPVVGGAEQQKIVNITHRAETASFSLGEATVEGDKLPADALTITSEPVKEGQNYRLTVTYAGSLPKGTYNGTVVVHTTDKDEPQIKIPLFLNIV